MTDLSTLDFPAAPEPRPGLVIPPSIALSGEKASVVAERSPLKGLRYVAMAVPNLREALAFYRDVWGLYTVAMDGNVAYLGAVGTPEPYILRLRESPERRLDVIAFAAKSADAVDTLATELGTAGFKIDREPAPLQTPGGGYGFRFFDIDGRLIEVSSDVRPKPFRDLEEGESIPRKMSHVVVTSPDTAKTRAFYEQYLGFRVSDYLSERMCFMRCSTDHHSLAIAQHDNVSVNHVSFEMRGIDEYLRGTGRLIRTGFEPLWGPGRHSAGDNTYAYFQDPNGYVVEYTTELEQILDEDAWQPRIWPTDNEYADQWGTGGSGEDLYALKNKGTPDEGLWTSVPV